MSSNPFRHYIPIFAIALATIGCSKQSPVIVDSEAISRAELRIEQFCGNCHPLPAPSTFPKRNWPEEVDRGFKFYFESGRSDLDQPLVAETVAYFQSRAPERVVVPDATSFPVHKTNTQFAPGPLMMSGDKLTLTADIKWNSSSQSLLLSDMASGKLRLLGLDQLTAIKAQYAEEQVKIAPESVVGTGNNLCRVTLCDLNNDQIQDYLVAEIGSTRVSDQKLGFVAYYQGQPDGSLSRIVLSEGLARPVEAVAIDYDDDGDLDILVAEFGYHSVGCLSLLRNISNSNNPKADDYRYEIIDPRHGYVALQLADMNNDGLLDIVTAIGQEYEQVQISYKQADGGYRSEIVMALPDPSYNTSSITIADIDKDGLLDIVHTCGDIFDSFIPKPFHGVRWIRNLGQGRWETRELGMLIGAMQAAVADFDQDGDMDIVAVGLFPSHARFATDTSFDSICWWEQKEDLTFVRHSIERDRCLHSSCAVADLDNDGRFDLIVGEWADEHTPASARIFWNRPKKLE